MVKQWNISHIHSHCKWISSTVMLSMLTRFVLYLLTVPLLGSWNTWNHKSNAMDLGKDVSWMRVEELKSSDRVGCDLSFILTVDQSIDWNTTGPPRDIFIHGSRFWLRCYSSGFLELSWLVHCVFHFVNWARFHEYHEQLSCLNICSYKYNRWA